MDILDEQGHKTGQVLGDREIYERGMWHGAVFIWIINSKKEILMQFRASDKRLNPSCWDASVAGHISAGYDAATTAVKEIKEEIGLDVEAKDLKYLCEYSEEIKNIEGKPHREYMTTYALYKDVNTTNLKLQKEELSDVRWFTPAELRDMLTKPERRKELSNHQDKLFEYAIEATKQ